jgi:hypothetical protein
MSQRQHTGTSAFSAGTDAVDSSSSTVTIVIDDSWLEGLLDNLALARLSRSECIDLVCLLEEFEHASANSNPELPSSSITRAQPKQILVGDHFNAAFNEYGMRAPDSMTSENVLETISSAARHFALHGHGTALRQLVFFIAANLDEVIEDDESDAE